LIECHLPAAVDSAAIGDAIKTAFKTQAMQMHPDRFVSAAEDERKLAHVRFQKLQVTYVGGWLGAAAARLVGSVALAFDVLRHLSC
jgi:hypothetical protein